MKTIVLLASALVCVAWTAGCGSDDPAEGGIGERCYPNGTCDGELSCVSGRCVDLNDVCGNGTCESSETYQTCPADCSESCGNGACDSGETPQTCPADCSAEPCGNGALDTGEVCDGAELDGQTCVSQGYDMGDLACETGCAAFDVSDCAYEPCGNGALDTGEVCDGAELDGETCVSQGYDTGNLACEAGCAAFDFSDCAYEPCGNGTLDTGEVCDGAELDGETCLSQGFGPGTLNCATDCASFDTSSCDPCATCNDWWTICQNGGSCFPDQAFCAGPSEDALNALWNCLCGPVGSDCDAHCPYICSNGTVGTPADDQNTACTTCLSGGLAVQCSSELNDCINN